MKILIIGSEGFIGSNCVKYFTQIGYNVWGVDLFNQSTQAYKYNKISRLSDDLVEIIKSNQFDVLINASGSANVNYSMTHPFIDFESNCLDVIILLEGIRKYQNNCKYIHISSAAVYGNPIELPINEFAATNPLSPYGWHKLISENLCNEYSSVYGIQTVIVRPFSVYGPGLRKQLFWDLFQKIKSSNGIVELWGTGNESRDFIYIDDFVIAIHILIKNAKMNGDVFNLASGQETSIANAINLFINSYDSNVQFKFNGHVREGDPLNWKADISKLTTLGFNPSFNIKSGITKLANWLKIESEK
jgi:UDP-glucose 4-epimerase